ncbi:MAG: GIY-YIG nuclease family protein [Candidatus Moraniibacteriota bacterium]
MKKKIKKIEKMERMGKMKKNLYALYMLRCADGTLYTGITVDVRRRISEHNSSSLGAKYTRGRRPVKLVFSKLFRNRSEASGEEARIKKLSRAEKLAMIKKKI